MRVIFPKSMKASLAAKSKKPKDTLLGREPENLIKVDNVVEWETLEFEYARKHVGPFLEYMKNNHDETNPVFTSQLLRAMDESDANQSQAIEQLRSMGSIISFSDLLALLGPAVEYALVLLNDEEARTPENIERFVIALVLALAEMTNQFGEDEELVPLDKDVMDGITVTVRNIIFAFRKDFTKINYGDQMTFIAKMLDRFGPRCFPCCGAKRK